MGPAARHVFHHSTGSDRIAAWREAVSEPVFVFGTQAEGKGKFFFRSVKREFRKWLQRTADTSITVYHDGLGSDCLGPLDPALHKVMVMHNWYPRWKQNFEWMIRSTARVVVPTDEHRELLKNTYRWIPEKYILSQRGPIIADNLGNSKQSSGKKRTGIWLHGENWKRYGNSLRRVVDQWPADAGEIEVICSGRKGFSSKSETSIKWSFHLPMEFALIRLYTWDSVLLLNDYSLQAPWLRFALNLGLFPLIPSGESPAAQGIWQAENAPRSYDWGNYREAAEILEEWRNRKPDLDSLFSDWVKLLLQQQQSDSFAQEWQDIKSRILGQNAPKLRPIKPAPGWMPVSLYEKVQRLRSGL